MRFQNTQVLVTGASSGIGKACAVRLASEGARIALVARDAERLNGVRNELSGDGHDIFQCDLTDEAPIGEMMNQLRAGNWIFSGVVHAAGVHWLRPLQLISIASINQMMASHVGSALLLSRSLLSNRLLAKEKCSMVWISSAAALQGGAATAEYSAAKAGMAAASRVLAVELARRKVRVNVIAPGVVRTPQSEAFLGKLTSEQVKVIENEHLLGLGEPSDVAGAIAFLLSDDARWITGTTMIVDGGLTCH